MICPTDFPEFGTDWDWDGETVMKATGFVHQIESSTFLVSKFSLHVFHIYVASLSSYRSRQSMFPRVDKE